MPGNPVGRWLVVVLDRPLSYPWRIVCGLIAVGIAFGIAAIFAHFWPQNREMYWFIGAFNAGMAWRDAVHK